MSITAKWPDIQFGEIADFRNGLNFTKENFGKGIKVIGVSDFQNYLIPKYDELSEINPEGVVKSDDLLREGDILFVRSNGNRSLIGRSLFLSGIEGKISHSAFTIRARIFSNKAMPRFYAYLFRTSLIRETLSAYGGGTNISNLNQGILKQLKVPLPPLSTQHKIAAILSAYDDLIENNTRRIKILEEMAQALYREWFVHFRFPGHEGMRMVESELGLIPDGWNIEKVKNILKRLPVGKAYTQSEVSDKGQFQVIDQSRDDILGYHDGPPSQIASPESPIIIFGDHTCKMQMLIEPFSVGPNVIPFVSKNNLPIPYLYFLIHDLIETKEYKRHWTELTNKTVVFTNGKNAQLFSDIIKPNFEQMRLLKMKNTNLSRTRDLILPKLISGELDVSELDIMIPEAMT